MLIKRVRAGTESAIAGRRKEALSMIEGAWTKCLL